jgi:hypothetical protein
LRRRVDFSLLRCNDKELIGPWANSFKLNVFTALVALRAAVA